jgi:putative transposase
MPRPYSNDLRERVVAAVQSEGLSCHQAAARFGVAPSTAINWVRRFRERGDVAPAQIGGYRRRQIQGSHADWLSARVRERDFTLRGLVAELAERGLKADYYAVWTFVHAQKLTHKKRRWSPASRTAPTSPADAPNG